MADFTNYKKALKDFSNKRNMEFDEFLDDYKKRNYPPLLHRIFPSIKFWLALFSGVCAVMASGLRVYDRFFQVAQQSGAQLWLSVGEAFFGVGAVNIALVAMSFAVAYTKKKMSNTSLTIGLITTVGISLVAGLGQSFSGLKMVGVMGFFDWILAISLAALTALEYLSGDLMGCEYVSYEQEKKEVEKKYSEEYKHWLSAARANFPSWKAQFVNWCNEQGIKTDDVSKQDEQLVLEKQTRSRSSHNANIIRRLLNKLYSETNELPGVIQIASLLANELVESGRISQEDVQKFVEKKKGYVSQVRRDWINEKGLLNERAN